MRSFLAILIATVQIAGSWLCCCGPERLLARLAHRPVPGMAQLGGDPEPTCPNCRKLEEPRDLPSPSPTDRPKPSQPVLPESCPCGGATIEAAPTVTPVLERFLLDLQAAGDSLTTSSVTLDARPLSPDRGVYDLPFLPGEARLFVHHALRC